MADPRLDGDHLGQTRRASYYEAADRLLGACGEQTISAANCRPALPPRTSAGATAGGYALLDLHTGRRHSLKVGLNTLGRSSGNDVQIDDMSVSRRHSVILLHTDGTCEIHDTASRNGTKVNGQTITDPAAIGPGDTIQLCGRHFLLSREAVTVRPAGRAGDTQFLQDDSRTGPDSD